MALSRFKGVYNFYLMEKLHFFLYIKSDSVANEEEDINAYQIVQDTQVHR